MSEIKSVNEAKRDKKDNLQELKAFTEREIYYFPYNNFLCKIYMKI